MTGKKILIVDDEVAFSENLKGMFEMKGCEVWTAADTAQALRKFLEVRPDSCVIDVHLTGSTHDGIEFLQMIRDVDAMARCVMLSCEDDESCKRQAEIIGISGYFEKPLSDFTGFMDFVIGD
jgi:two-component system chemotaxis response regulator CheY